jgi:asparagine synthase (glutamine-hydrolysing)
MCGIAGVMSRDGRPQDRSTLAALAGALAHRGPDGHGMYSQAGVDLVHTRLAIIDLAQGAQPLISDDGVALIANGEIYNDPDLRRALPAHFKTNSDCESALHLYIRDGLDFARGLRGMYAIAIHDPVRKRLVLTRDPFGIKPLYYAQTSTGFCFASEPRALIASGLVSARLNPAARDEVLGTQFSAGIETPFAGISRVQPGETLVIEKGEVTARLRLPAITNHPDANLDDGGATARFGAVWEDSIEAHQRSDVPYGMFLSGGIDSTAVLAVMARLNAQPVLAFTAAFPDTGVHDERASARAAAAAVGAIHVEVEVTAADFWNALPAIAEAMDDPVTDYAAVPTFLLAKQAARDVKVVLTGEGGDEMFAGYGRYRAATRTLFPKRPWRRPLLAFDGLRAPLRHWRRAIDAAESEAAAAGFRGLDAVQAVDCATWLPGDLLTKLDRCLMAHGLEGRVPFLDPKIAAFAFALPDRQKVRGRGKWVVRQWLSESLRVANAFLPKRGFTVPVAEWIATEGRKLGPLVARSPGVAEICHPEAVERLYAGLAPGRAPKGGAAAWMLLFYALWYRRHMLGLRAVGDVFSTLAAK